jgi:Flp pilus assembly protein TadB
MLANMEYSLVRAGLRSQMTAEQFLGVCEVSAAGVGLLLLGLTQLFGMPLIGGVLAGFSLGAVIGFALPIMALNSRAADRIALIEKRLPFAIEFMLLAMEASAALPQAMAVYRDIMEDDPLASEFGAVLVDIDRGLSQVDALKAMGARLDSAPMTAFLLAVVIGLDTGQPIKEVLQTQADATRRVRFQNAEEVAKTAGTRAIFPLFIVVLGILMLVLGPMAIKIIQGDLL